MRISTLAIRIYPGSRFKRLCGFGCIHDRNSVLFLICTQVFGAQSVCQVLAEFVVVVAYSPAVLRNTLRESETETRGVRVPPRIRHTKHHTRRDGRAGQR